MAGGDEEAFHSKERHNTNHTLFTDATVKIILVMDWILLGLEGVYNKCMQTTCIIRTALEYKGALEYKPFKL